MPLATCPPEPIKAPDPIPFISQGNINFKAHDVGWLLCGIFTLVSVLASFWLILKHLTYYSTPYQQRHIVRILLLVPIYSTVSFLSYLFYRHAIYYQTLRDCYEAVVLTDFFYLILSYVGETSHEHDLVFRNLKLKKWVWPLGRWSYRPSSGHHFLLLMKVSILQYAILRPLCTFISVGLEYFGLYCLKSWSPSFGHIYMSLTITISVTVAMYCIIQFYVPIRDRVDPFKPVLKFLAIKSVVFLTFWQDGLLSLLVYFGAIKESEYWTATEIQVGLNALLTCFEMMLFSFLHIKAFSYLPYRPSDRARRTRRWSAMIDCLNFSDWFYEIKVSTASLLLRRKRGGLSEVEEIRVKRYEVLKQALGKERRSLGLDDEHGRDGWAMVGEEELRKGRVGKTFWRKGFEEDHLNLERGDEEKDGGLAVAGEVTVGTGRHGVPGDADDLVADLERQGYQIRMVGDGSPSPLSSKTTSDQAVYDPPSPLTTSRLYRQPKLPMDGDPHPELLRFHQSRADGFGHGREVDQEEEGLYDDDDELDDQGIYYHLERGPSGHRPEISNDGLGWGVGGIAAWLSNSVGLVRNRSDPRTRSSQAQEDPNFSSFVRDLERSAQDGQNLDESELDKLKGGGEEGGKGNQDDEKVTSTCLDPSRSGGNGVKGKKGERTWWRSFKERISSSSTRSHSHSRLEDEDTDEEEEDGEGDVLDDKLGGSLPYDDSVNPSEWVPGGRSDPHEVVRMVGHDDSRNGGARGRIDLEGMRESPLSRIINYRRDSTSIIILDASTPLSIGTKDEKAGPEFQPNLEELGGGGGGGNEEKIEHDPVERILNDPRIKDDLSRTDTNRPSGSSDHKSRPLPSHLYSSSPRKSLQVHQPLHPPCSSHQASINLLSDTTHSEVGTSSHPRFLTQDPVPFTALDIEKKTVGSSQPLAIPKRSGGTSSSFSSSSLFSFHSANTSSGGKGRTLVGPKGKNINLVLPSPLSPSRYPYGSEHRPPLSLPPPSTLSGSQAKSETVTRSDVGGSNRSITFSTETRKGDKKAMTADRNPTSPSSSKAATKEKAKTAEVEERQVVETLKRKMDPRAMILPSGLSLNQYRSKMKEEEVLESDEEEMVEDRTPSPPRKAPRSKGKKRELEREPRREDGSGKLQRQQLEDKDPSQQKLAIHLPPPFVLNKWEEERARRNLPPRPPPPPTNTAPSSSSWIPEEGGFHAKGRGRDRPDDGKVGERSQRARVGVGVGSTMMSLSENPKLEMDLRKSQRVSLEYLESLEAKRRRLWEYEQGRRRRDWRDPRPSPRPMASGQNRSMSSNQVGSLFPLPDQGISIRTGLEESRGGREEHTLPPRTRTNLTPSSLTREWERSRGYPNP